MFIEVYFELLTTSQEEEIISSSATLPGYSGYILKFKSGDFVYIKSHSTKLITIIGWAACYKYCLVKFCASAENSIN